MKVQWEEVDIKPGRIVGKPDRAERHMIGYTPGMIRGDNGWRTLNSLADGQVLYFKNNEEVVTHLNDTGDLPVELFAAEKVKMA